VRGILVLVLKLPAGHELLPLTLHSDLQAYKKDKELIRYLYIASVEEERDIYEASPENASIKKMRPPFYMIFDASEDDIASIVQHFNIEDLALALFDTPRDWRAKIEKQMDEKEKFLYYEYLKQFDRAKPKREEIGSVRMSVAQYFSDLIWLKELHLDTAELSEDSNATEAA